MIDFEQCLSRLQLELISLLVNFDVARMLIINGGAIRMPEIYYFFFQFEGGGPDGPYIESRGIICMKKEKNSQLL